jgi:excinuclease ABC subunit B
VERSGYDVEIPETQEQILKVINDLEKEMQNAAIALEFEKAAKLRDEIFRLKNELNVEK